MKRVTGLGGLFFKAKDPVAMYGWYEKHLGISSSAVGEFLRRAISRLKKDEI